MSVSHNEEKNQKLARMKELIRTLNEAARVYYVDMIKVVRVPGQSHFPHSGGLSCAL